MQWVFRFVVFVLMVSANGLPVYAASPEAPAEMRFCYENQDYLPFIRHVRSGVVSPGNNGALPDLIIKTTRKMGLKAQFISKPWKRCIVLLEAGEVDGIFAAIWQPERDAWGAFPKHEGQPDSRYHLWQVDYKIYAHIESGLSWNGEHFNGVASGVSAPLGYVAEKRLRQQGVLSRSNYLPAEGLNLVAKNRLDGYVLESSIGDYLIQHLGLQDQVRALGRPFFSAEWYLPLSHHWVKQYPDTSRQFWKILAEIREQEGEQIKARYHN